MPRKEYLMSKKPSLLRYEYSGKRINETGLLPNPVLQFKRWFDEALKSGVPMANAMNLSTVSEKGLPQSRIVLLKEFGAKGFVFFTHYHSPKGRALKKKPYASLLFYWPALERQVRIDGRTQKVSPALSDAYFRTRPRPYQIQAHLANQSEVISSRQQLEERYRELEMELDGKKVTRPPDWGGYLLSPEIFEFWHGQPSRLHDRILYEKKGAKWVRKRLAP